MVGVITPPAPISRGNEAIADSSSSPDEASIRILPLDKETSVHSDDMGMECLVFSFPLRSLSVFSFSVHGKNSTAFRLPKRQGKSVR